MLPLSEAASERGNTIDILQLVDRLEELLEKGWRIPITNKVVVDESLFLNMIDQMRITLPKEVQQAQELQRARDQFIARAQEDAKQIMLHAQREAASQMDEIGLREMAQEQARLIVEGAYDEAEVIRAGADEYAESQLKQLGRSAADLLRIVRNGLEYIEKRRSEYHPGDDDSDGQRPEGAAETPDGAEGYDGEAEQEPYESYSDDVQ